MRFVGYEKTKNNLAFIRLISVLEEQDFPELEYSWAEYQEPALQPNQHAKAYWDKAQQKVVWNIITIQEKTLEAETLSVARNTQNGVETVSMDNLITMDMALEINNKLDAVIAHLNITL